jgi:hypothetical protein
VAITGASLSGTTTQTAQNGVAIFDDLSISATGSYTLTFTDASLTTAISNSFNIVAGTATKLVFTAVPGTATVKKPIGTVQVQLEDAFGNVAITDTAKVKIAASKKGVLKGTLTQTPQSGLATFTGLSFSSAGFYKLTATGGTLTPATSDSITVSSTAKPKPAPKPAPHPTPTSLPLQPISEIAGTLLPKIVIESNTDFGLTSDSSKKLTVTFEGVPANGVAVPAHTFRVTGGYSTLSNLRIRSAGTYTMVIADGLGNTVTDQVTILPAKAVALKFVTQPTSVEGSTPVVVRAVDAFGNPTTALNGTQVTLRLGPLPQLGRKPKLTGTITATLVNGIATFTDASVARKGRARLLASAAKLRSVASAIFVNS